MAHYMILSRMHGLALDVAYHKTDPGTPVQMWKRKGKDNQLWYDDPATGTIRTKLNGFCLDIEGDGLLRIMPYQPGDPNQLWERDVQHGYIRNRVNRNRVLDILNQDKERGAKVTAWEAHGGPNQLWNFEGPGAVPAAQPAVQPVVTRRNFFIVSEMHSKVLDVKGASTSPGTKAIMYTRNSPPSKNQLWYTDPQGFVRSALNDFALDAQPGHNIVLQPFNGGPTQQWIVEGNHIKNKSNGEVLDIVRENKDNGAELCSYRSNNQKNQQWRIEHV
jgi:hypothetical protein